ncbi:MULTISPECIES: DUF2130 domain-containing protein [unclassified Nitratiruptor]|uniref:DUF2130 domain-containing protein n=1 Tax=unclassified Nitratiruptor TaxID=2624044 RepID=UPI0019165C02|nr:MULTISPECIES: DUF2130 domain-containing protein [unclassified Nitratiruptor]BCD59477.1 hypothetical protein NitYY0810_C0219 [Nitratiruptor sp. YY08-10]BCD63401.1 hypothetical protein NitYY0814_C0219 [Nitratiruptor sp. YY08-14]
MHTIKCPNCGYEIDINQTLYEEIEKAAKAKLQKEIEAHRKQYKNELSKLKAQEEALKAKETALEAKANQLAQELLSKERQNLEREIKKRLENEQKSIIEHLKKELEEKSNQVKELNEAKIEIEKLKRQKDEAIQQARLQAQKELNEELAKAKEQLSKQLAQENELKLKEKEKQLEDLKHQLEEAKRKAELTSQQLRGEVQELAIEEYLKNQFPFDAIEEIKKGQRGADCIQIVNTRELQNCGKIYYESKRAKEFKKEWIEKFKADMRNLGCDIGVLVTQSMPKGMDRMGLLDGVWVCSFEEFKALSAILRENLIKIALIKKSQENRGEKMAMLYSYLTSDEFRMQIEAIVEGFTQMQQDLEAEKRAMARIWKQRQKQIEKVLENTISMYASIKGIAGSAISHIKALELPYSED